jgi:hypothetical protein
MAKCPPSLQPVSGLICPVDFRRAVSTRSELWLCLYAADRYGVEERGVVALVLVGVGLGEGSDCAIEDVRGT